jgi:hypothetical protein
METKEKEIRAEPKYKVAHEGFGAGDRSMIFTYDEPITKEEFMYWRDKDIPHAVYFPRVYQDAPNKITIVYARSCE